MNKLQILDVTLRDGGCVNNFNFGKGYMNQILHSLEDSNIEYIELGYIDSRNGSEDNRTQFIDEKCIYHNFLINKKENTKYVAMIDFGKFDISKLEPRNPKSIDGIRFCFHKKDRFNMIESCLKILSLGYECFIQPMLTLRYTDEELIELIEIINSKLSNITSLYIVDSFGEMRSYDIKNYFFLFDKYLNKDIAIGFHSHNNLQLSYSNAIEFINIKSERNKFLDSSIMGMGKGAGNLNTELLLEHINLLSNNKKYNISPLLNVMDSVIKPLHNEFKWGYSIEYYLSSINHCTPSYAAHYYNKHMLSVNKINELLSLISEEKKISFDKEYAEKLYAEYNINSLYKDEADVSTLNNKLINKDILLIAPGKSILNNTYDIISNSKNKIIISLNFEVPFIKSDYIIVTRDDTYEKLKNTNNKLIISSNVTTNKNGNHYILDYKKWIEKTKDGIFDSSLVFGVKLALSSNINSIYLAGVDGFSSNINNNYYSKEIRRGLNEDEVNKRNSFYKDFLKEVSKKVEVKYITSSLYKE